MPVGRNTGGAFVRTERERARRNATIEFQETVDRIWTGRNIPNSPSEKRSIETLGRIPIGRCQLNPAKFARCELLNSGHDSMIDQPANQWPMMEGVASPSSAGANK